MLPCQKDCPRYCQGCHKDCPHWRALQACQREARRRKKAYLRRADESCRQMLSLYRKAGGYLGPQTGR